MKTVFLFSIIAITFSAYAEPDSHKVIELGLGTRYEGFLYKEELTPPQKSTETATFATILGDLKLYAPDRMSHLDLRYETSGQVNSHYDGSDQQGNPAMATDKLSFINYEGVANLALSDMVTVYIGYGYRYWNRYLGGGTPYREIYSWYYTPVGTTLWVGKSSMMDWGIDGSLRPTSRGTIKVITSQTISGGQDSQMTLGSETGYKLALPIRWHLGDISFTTSPWFEHSAIGQSNTVLNSTLASQPGTGILEPNSHTNQFGIEVLLSYAM